MDLGLKGLRALVSGGTKGIGRAVAGLLADEGASVAICARDEGEVEATAADLQAGGVSVFGQALDVSDGPGLKSWVESAASALDGLDIVVANVSALATTIRSCSTKNGLLRLCFNLIFCAYKFHIKIAWTRNSLNLYLIP